MRSKLKFTLAAALFAACAIRAEDAPIVEGYFKFVSAKRPLAGVGIMQDKTPKALVIATDMLTESVHYRGPARLELIELLTNETPPEENLGSEEKDVKTKRPTRGVKATPASHVMTPAGKTPVAWIDLPTKQGQLHLILMVNPGNDNGITAIQDVPGSFPPGSNRYFNLCTFPLTIRLPSGDQLIPPGGSKVARPGSKDNDYYDLEIFSRINEQDVGSYSGRLYHLETVRKLYLISAEPGSTGRIAVKVIVDRPPSARGPALRPPEPKGAK
jgi:hypothetical protein